MVLECFRTFPCATRKYLIKKPLVTTIVVNWNLKNETAECLHSLECLEYPTRVLVVDNGSEDGSGNFLDACFPAVEIIRSPINLGFGAACNLAITHLSRALPPDFIFLLNNDAVVHPLTLTKLLEEAEASPEAGIWGPKIYYRDTPDKIWYAGARMRKVVLAAADTGRGQLEQGQFDRSMSVDYVFGAAMLIHWSVLERIGLFDDAYFIYLEDLDFCLRAKLAGFSIRFVPKSHVWHTGSASTTNALALRRYHLARSTVLFLKKHISPLWIPLATIFWLLVFLKVVLTDILNGDLESLTAGWWGMINALTGEKMRSL